MGGTSSKATTKVLNQTDLNIDQSTYENVNQSCSQSGSANNIVEIIGSQGVKLTVDQKNELQQMCKLNAALKAQKDSAATIELFNKLSADSVAKGGLVAANSEVEQDIRNQMNVSLDQSTYANILQSCTSKSNTDNIVRIVGSKDVDANVSQVNKAINECIMQYGNELGLTASAAATAKTEAEAKTSAEGASLLGLLGLDGLLTGLFGAAMAPWAASGIVICCIVILCALCIFGGMFGGGGGVQEGGCLECLLGD